MANLKEPEVDEGVEARVLHAMNNPVRASSPLITPINLVVTIESSYVSRMKKPLREGLAKLKAIGKKVVHVNSKKRKTISEASSLDAGVITSSNIEPLSPPIVVLYDESIHTPPSSSKEKEKEVHSIARETSSRRPLMIHDSPKVVLSRKRGFCEFAAYETHVANQKMRLEATKLDANLKGSEEIISNLRDELEVEKAGAFTKADQITGLEAHVKTLEMTLSSAKVDAINEFVARDEYHRMTCEYFDSSFEDFRRRLQVDFPELDLSKYQADDNTESVLMDGDNQAPGDDQEYDAAS
ncbi:hypothetical protein FCV25MIE_15245 [Fagus crenata]